MKTSKPDILKYAKGFYLRNTLVRSILSTTDEYEMHETDADAILLDYFIMPSEAKLKKIFASTEKPVIVSVKVGHTTPSKLAGLATNLEKLGAAAIYAGRWVPHIQLQKICGSLKIPVLAYASQSKDDIAFKLSSGAFGLCLSSKILDRKFLHHLETYIEYVPIIGIAGKSNSAITQCLQYDINAVIYEPFTPPEIMNGF